MRLGLADDSDEIGRSIGAMEPYDVMYVLCMYVTSGVSVSGDRLPGVITAKF